MGKEERLSDHWRYRLFRRVARTTVVVLGSVVLTGWFLRIEALKSIFPGLVSVKPNTAASLATTTP